MKLVFIILFCLFTGVLCLKAQETNEPADTSKKEFYLIKKNDGAEYIGEILSDDGREVLILTKNIGKIYVPKADIASMSAIDQNKLTITSDGAYQDYRLEGPYTTRYFFSTNALPIKKKENYMMIGLQGPEAHFAVSDNLSLGVMATWIASPLALAAKYSFNAKPNAKTHYAVGTILATSGYLMQGQGVGGIHWLTATRGDRTSNISLSAGYAFAYTGDGFSNYYGNRYEFNNSSGAISQYSSTLRSVLQTQENINLYEYLDLDNTVRGSYVLGVSGITPIGKKSSLIIDVLGFVGSSYGREISSSKVYKDVTYSNGGYRDQNGTWQENIVTEDVTVNEYSLVKDGLRPHVIIMPAMRFHKSYDKAFQVALAGVITTQSSGDVIAFPVPTISWLRQF